MTVMVYCLMVDDDDGDDDGGDDDRDHDCTTDVMMALLVR